MRVDKSRSAYSVGRAYDDEREPGQKRQGQRLEAVGESRPFIFARKPDESQSGDEREDQAQKQLFVEEPRRAPEGAFKELGFVPGFCRLGKTVERRHNK